MNVKSECVQPSAGVIDATIVRVLPQIEGKLSWKYLKPGETIEVPAGKAYVTRHPSYYLKAQFFEPGSMTGPVVFSEAEIEDPRVAVENSFSVPDYLLLPTVGVMCSFIFFFGAIFSPEDTTRSMILSTSTFATLLCAFSFMCLVKNGPAFLDGGEKALAFMKKRKVIWKEHPVNIDAGCLSEICPQDTAD